MEGSAASDPPCGLIKQTVLHVRFEVKVLEGTDRHGDERQSVIVSVGDINQNGKRTSKTRKEVL